MKDDDRDVWETALDNSNEIGAAIGAAAGLALARKWGLRLKKHPGIILAMGAAGAGYAQPFADQIKKDPRFRKTRARK